MGWDLEQRGKALFALSYKQSASINNKTATSELAFLCDQRNKMGVIGAILIPFDGTFENHQDPIPVSIQKKSDEYDRSDLLQNWKNGSEFLFLDVPDDVADLIALLKEKGADLDIITGTDGSIGREEKARSQGSASSPRETGRRRKLLMGAIARY